MANFNEKQLTEYLKVAKDLEFSIYEQEHAIEAASDNITMKSVDERIWYDKPAVNPPSAPVEPKMPPMSVLISGIALIILGIIVFSAWDIKNFWGWLILILGILGLVIYISDALKMGERNKKYNEELARYQHNIKVYEKEYSQQLEAYNQNVAKEKALIALEKAAALKEYDKAKEQLQPMKDNLIETKNLLQKLYEKNIVFPKYRNIVAITTMYEYLVTGRCSELAGPNGAYNLYESELRQDRIINQLDKISNQLDIIQQNQYQLYEEYTQANEQIRLIGTAGLKLMSNIADNTAITAYCAKISALNNSAQTSLMLWD